MVTSDVVEVTKMVPGALLNDKGGLPTWLEQAAQEAWQKAEKVLKSQSVSEDIAKYREDPIGFCKDLLGMGFTDDVVRMLNSVVVNPVTIARSANSVGKTYSAAALAVWFYSVFPDAQVYLTAAPPIENLKKLLWGKIATIARKKPTLFGGHQLMELAILRHKESFIMGVTIPTTGTKEEREAKFSGKHAPHLLFIVDEGDGVPDEVYKGIESCMSGGMARLLILFNPRVKAGPVWEKEEKGQANVVEMSAFSHPNVITGEDVIPGAVSREITVRRIHQWTRPLAGGEVIDDNCFEVPEFLIGHVATALDGKQYPPLQGGWRKVTDPAFFYMVLGIYPSQAVKQLISESWITAARKRWDEYVAAHGEIPPKDERPIMGLDLAEYGTDYNVACLRYKETGFVPKVKILSLIHI